MSTTATPNTTKVTKVKRISHDGLGDGCSTVLFNCNCHTFESVIAQVVYAVGCSLSAARRYAHIAHTNGKVTVFSGTREECEQVADKLAEIGLVVRVTGWGLCQSCCW